MCTYGGTPDLKIMKSLSCNYEIFSHYLINYEIVIIMRYESRNYELWSLVSFSLVNGVHFCTIQSWFEAKLRTWSAIDVIESGWCVKYYFGLALEYFLWNADIIPAKNWKRSISTLFTVFPKLTNSSICGFSKHFRNF